MTKRLVIIDGKSVFYRGYYAMPNLATKDGRPTGGVYGFAALSLEVMKRLKPDYVVVAWDKKGTNIRKRKQIYPKYKAGRKPAPPDFYEQIPLLYELLEAFSWPLIELDDYEADDIMGTLAVQAADQQIETCLVTSDLDVLQCIGPLTHVYAMKTGFTNIELFSPTTFKNKYDIDVHQFLDLKALKGDSSDNIPGVAGVGEKTALELLKNYHTLDGIYEHLDDIKPAIAKKLAAGKDSAYMSKQVAEIWCDAPTKLDLDAADVRDLDQAKIVDLFKTLQFTSLINKLPGYMAVSADEAPDTSAELPVTELKDLDEPAKVALVMAPAVIATELDEDRWLLSDKVGTAYVVNLAKHKYLVGGLNLVAYDLKPLLKRLLSLGYVELPLAVHDVRQAAFLLDPLSKYRGLGDLAEATVESAEQQISALHKIYPTQAAQLDDLPKLADLARNIDFRLIPILARMEFTGIKLDTEQLADMDKELDKKLNEVKRQMFDMVGYEFNIGSPAQLAEVLFGKLQLSTVGIKKGKTGYSTGQKELDKLRGSHPIIELIEQYRELSKLQNTYVESLPKLVDDRSRLHTTFNQDVAATGRLSSTDPNLQNIPIRSEAGRKIREAFVPAKGNVFVSADYSQFELRLAAVLAGDKAMIDDFNSDIDIHAKTASDVYGVPLSEITKNQRRDAKVINFGVLYGMGPHALAQNTGMSFVEAKQFIDDYFKLRAPIRKYIDTTIEQAKTDGYVETLFGRRRPSPDVNSSNFVVREAAKRAAANMPIQGTEADLMKMAMIEVEKKLNGASMEQSTEETGNSKENELPMAGNQASSEDAPLRANATQILQIHDSILVECKQADAEAVGQILKDTMENIYPDLGIKLKVDVTHGPNWGVL
ncbi:MAG TPA: DNA polymerase I [Candidatus Saccharimonadales bacterium]|nr:DNA polymerase I [Candidatus Saccharimonadales bacterium]